MEGCHTQPAPVHPLRGQSSDAFTVKKGLDAGSLLRLRLNSLLDRALEGPAHGPDFSGARSLSGSGSASAGVVETGFHFPTPHIPHIPNPIDVIKGGLGAAKDLLHAGFDAVREALEEGGHFFLGKVEVVIDAANKTIDFAGDVADDLKGVVDVIKFAAEHGLKLTEQAREKIHGLILGLLKDALDVDGKVEALGVGDSYTLSGSAEAGWGVEASAEGSVEVTRTGEHSYVVSAEVGADVSGKFLGGATAGAGGRAEFTFDNPEDAERAALILAAGEAGFAAAVSSLSGFPVGSLLVPALAPTGDDMDFLRSNLSAMELTGSVGVDLDAKLGLGPADAGAYGEAEASHSYRMEFDHGKPVALVRTSELNVKADVTSSFVRSQLGPPADNALARAIDKGGEVTATVTAETRLPLDGTRITDVADFLTERNPAALLGKGETTIKASVVVDQGENGFEAEVELSGLSIDNARMAVGRLLRGDSKDVLRDLPFDLDWSYSSFTDAGDHPVIDLNVLGFGGRVEGRSEVRDRTLLGGSDACLPRPGYRNAESWRGAFQR
jgi:hypothetical protein